MEIERPKDWEEKKDLANYLLDIIQEEPILRNKLANLVVDIFEHKTAHDRFADNSLARGSLYYLIKKELNQEIESKATESGNKKPW